jgi:PAS domain S-box-containing protein
MNLRMKLLLGIGIALLVAFTLVAVFSYLSMEQSYRTLEKQEVQNTLESTVRSLKNDMKHTYSINRDYAAWTDTYLFAENQNPGWADQNTGSDFFTRFDLDYVLLFNGSGKFVFGRGYNSSSQMIEKVPAPLGSDIYDMNREENNVTSTEGTYGILDSPAGLFIFSSHPVLNDGFKGPAAGRLYILRSIDSSYLAALATRAGYQVTLIPAQEIAGDPSLARSVARITPESPVAVVPENADTVTGYVHVDDMRNPGGFYVRITEPRTIYHTGRDTIVFFLASLLGAGVFIILFVLLFIDRVVLSRLNAVISTVRKNGENGHNNVLHDDKGEDELSRLAQEIDPVFSQLTESRNELKQSEERYRTLVDQLPDYILVHRDGILIYVNPATATNLGYTPEMLIGKPLLPFIAPEYHETISKAIIKREAGKKFASYEIKIVARDGTYHTVLVNGAAIKYEGKPASLNVLTDITTLKQAEEAIRSANEKLEKRVTERTEALSRANLQLTAEISARNFAEQQITRSLAEKDLLLREIHHRVKNNLQIIASLLNLQSRYITDPKVLGAIRDSQSRVRAMALVHERIYRSENIAEINVMEYLDYLAKQIFRLYVLHPNRISISVTMADIMANIDTVIPIGLIMNELLSNSFKHAFPDGREGKVSIECTPHDTDRLRFVYHDNGIGIPEGFDWMNTESLGLRLVNDLVSQLNGTMVLGTGEGTTFIIDLQKTPAGKNSSS